MNAFDLARELGHEEVNVLRLGSTGLRVVIAIHDTTLGPAVGGTRLKCYGSFEEAIVDALRLSRAMTYKAAMADMAWGGAKAVIDGDPGTVKTPAFYAAYAETLNRVGRFQTGGDMGIDPHDVSAIARLTPFMTDMPAGATVDAPGLTALGVCESIRAAASVLNLELSHLHVALQGLGAVGWPLAESLSRAGVRLTISDVDPARVERAVARLGAAAVAPERIHAVEADIFSPCAVGGILNGETIPQLRCRAVVGAANEQLAESRHGILLHERGILYAPDYVANAGGLLSLLFERGEVDESGIVARVSLIGPRVASLWEWSRTAGVPPHILADRLVGEKLTSARTSRGLAS